MGPPMIGHGVGESRLPAVGVEQVLGDREEECPLVGEDAEQGAFGDAGRFGDLAGRCGRSVLDEQGHDRLDDRLAAVFRRKRGGSLSFRWRLHRRAMIAE